MTRADRTAAEMLLEDADSTGAVNRDWRKRAIGGKSSTEVVGDTGTGRKVTTRMGHRLAHLSSQQAAAENMSRESWIRALVAREIAELTGESADELIKPFGITLPRHLGLVQPE
jgi:CO dehydrogenase/acetyl-CoA synthase beta subunit